MTKVLVTAASKHGATTAIARAIGETLQSEGLETTVLPPVDVSGVAGYDAVVIGSAVYMGRWLEPARRLVERDGAALVARSVWLFSSGPVGDPPKPVEDPVDVAELIAAAGAREHRVFPGTVVKKGLGFGEKAVVAALRVPEGDFRPWDEIRAWAKEIAAALADAGKGA
jgi:menaquinone-dependent protoporphyrinogen oxidase